MPEPINMDAILQRLVHRPIQEVSSVSIWNSPFRGVMQKSPNTGSSDFFGFDDFTIGSRQQVVPPIAVLEPASVLGLIGIGIVGSLSLGKRSQR